MYCQQNNITMQPYPPACWISRRSTEELCRGKSRRISALSRAGSLQPRDSRDRSRTNRHSCDGVINYTSFLVQWLNHTTTTTGFTAIIQVNLPSVLWHCWLGGRKGIRPVRKLSGGCWCSYLSGASADLHIAQLMPLPLTVSCFSKIQIGFTFWHRLTWVVVDKGPLNGCVCVYRSTCELEQEDFIGAKFYCPHALVDGNQHIRIREKTALSTLSPYLRTKFKPLCLAYNTTLK